MMSAPTRRVETPHEVCHPYSCSPVSAEYWMSKARAKFCPSSWLVPICSALPSLIIPSQVHEHVAPANRSRAVFLPRWTGTARTSTMTAR